AIYRAQQLDKIFAKNGIVGELFCIPITIKDNIDIIGMETTSGSYALKGTLPIKDAKLVKKLKEENAIIIAKTTMDELAMGMNGFSSFNGRAGNPYDTTKNPGGSSAGAAASISANFAVIAIGTDNSGSIRIPAAFNGIYGIRPTQNSISSDGIFPMGNIDGTAGVMTRTVTDLAISLKVLS
ncbi:predicted protein, partial [Nematostella vectensis]